MASYRKRENGKWEYRISYKTADGKYKKKEKGGFTTKKAAQIEASKVERLLESDLQLDYDISLANYFDKWMEIYKKPNVSEITYKAYQNTSKKIKAMFNTRKLTAITSSQYQEAINEYASTHAQDTVERLNIHLKACVKMAVHEGYITRNFCDFVIINSTNKGRSKETKFLEIEEYQKVISTSYEKREITSYAVLYLIAKTGLRFAECLGLTTDNINAEQYTITVNKTWNHKSNSGFLPTKTKSSEREIPIDKETLDFLLELPKQDHYKIFPIVSNNAVNKTLRKIVGREVRVHSLRHTYASFLISQNIDLISISSVLGHENLNITLEVYAHQLQDQKKRNDDKIRKVFRGELGANNDKTAL